MLPFIRLTSLDNIGVSLKIDYVANIASMANIPKYNNLAKKSKDELNGNYPIGISWMSHNYE